jgi:hypothetical protein
VHFKISRGIAIEKPNDLIVIKNDISLPYVIDDVRLVSKYTGPMDKYDEITLMLTEKYGKPDEWARYRDNKGHFVTANFAIKYKGDMSNYGNIRYYGNSDYIKKLAALYTSHLGSLDSKSIGNKKDSSGGL